MATRRGCGSPWFLSIGDVWQCQCFVLPKLWPFEWENHDEPMELGSPHPLHRVNYFCSQNPRDCWNLFLQKCMTKCSVPTVPIQVIDGPSALKIPSPSLSGMDPDGMDPVSSNMAGRWEIPRTNWGFAGKTTFELSWGWCGTSIKVTSHPTISVVSSCRLHSADVLSQRQLSERSTKPPSWQAILKPLTSTHRLIKNPISIVDRWPIISRIYRFNKYSWLVISTNPSEKYMKTSWDDEIPNWMET